MSAVLPTIPPEMTSALPLCPHSHVRLLVDSKHSYTGRFAEHLRVIPGCESPTRLMSPNHMGAGTGGAQVLIALEWSHLDGFQVVRLETRGRFSLSRSAPEV